ncbi:MAG: adenylyl-sulfate kinase [Nitrospirae bacterium]|nr:adenylyl-sulfate kinase [Nitrospirota bacterium]
MAWVIWITGLPGSGKSTIALALEKRVTDAVILQSDEIRKYMTPEPDYSDSERDHVYRAVVFTAMTLYKLGHNVIIDATGNRSSWRELARKSIPHFYEIYLKCSLEICAGRERDRIETHGAPKNIYEKGGEGAPVPGINVPFELPESPEIIINTEEESPADAAERILKFLSGKGSS